MANKKSNLNLKETIQSTPVLWVGRTTNKNDERIMIWNNLGISNIILIEEINNKAKGHKLVIHAKEEVLKVRKQILESFTILFPEFSGLTIDKDTIESFEDVKVDYDYNEALFRDGFKFLDKELVTKVLSDAGIDISSYNYTEIKVDDSDEIVTIPTVCGYENYPEELKEFMTDTTKYAGKTISKQDEYYMLEMDCYKGIIAAGDAGTGKSFDASAYAEERKIPMITTQLSQGIDEDFIIGKWQPNEGKDGYTFCYGPLALALKYDCWLKIEEANYAPAGVTSCINSVLDDNGQLSLPNGEVLHRGPNFRLILTVNPGYRGTNQFNEATLNRFAVVYYAPITRQELVERLKANTGYKNTRVLEVIAEQVLAIRDAFEQDNKEVEVTYRNAERFLRMIRKAPKIDIEKQFSMAFLNNAIFDMDDIPTELADLKKNQQEALKNIKDAIKNATVAPCANGTLHIDIPTVDEDELDELENINDAGFIEL